MNVLVIGSGGREHALVWKIARSPKAGKIYCIPGNPGTAALAENVPADPNNICALADWAEKKKIDLTVVGPEIFLAAGVGDEFEKRGLPVFGPCRAAAEIECSKFFAKNLMHKYRIPTASYEAFSDYSKALEYLQHIPLPAVIKADGLAAGKGVMVAETFEQAERALKKIMNDKIFGEAGARVLIEEFLRGEEASLLAFSDGQTVLPMVSAQDHKRIFDGDQGPNTGGMGAYSPAPVVTAAVMEKIQNEILIPAVNGMAAEGRPFRGVLYAGLMISMDGCPKVVEFNARFGDPEAQAVLPRLNTDLLEVMMATVNGKLKDISLNWTQKAAVCVVLAAGGYPGDYQRGDLINGIEDAEKTGCLIFHAGTALMNEMLVTAGGRILNVVALANDIPSAVAKVYMGTEKISYRAMHYRRDIAVKALGKI
ncbi:MAG: phosphoribosylamine--glycine ligase [Bacillota bacterium]